MLTQTSLKELHPDSNVVAHAIEANSANLPVEIVPEDVKFTKDNITANTVAENWLVTEERSNPPEDNGWQIDPDSLPEVQLTKKTSKRAS